MRKPTYNTVDVLAVALAAFKQLGSQIVKPASYQPEGAPKVVSNKELIIDHFVNGKTLTVDMTAAQELRDSIAHRLMMNVLKGENKNQFFNEIATILAKDVVTARDFGIIAWAPKLAVDFTRADDQRTALIVSGAASNYIGKVGDKIRVKFTKITGRYLSTYNLFVHNGHDEYGNLISFFNKKELDSDIMISARVKRHEISQHLAGNKVTVINYVKQV
jgi:hypothetical protein